MMLETPSSLPIFLSVPNVNINYKQGKEGWKEGRKKEEEEGMNKLQSNPWEVRVQIL